ncbi:hypothetical protein N431DRAFT_462049 [Stipitochalara longipes BDJ]|nr:hypothetical protein N431DRAFT_462049 [Stipitochalara longipes BDJ]
MRFYASHESLNLSVLLKMQSRIVVCWILVFLSFLLSLLVLCAGTKPNFLPNACLVFVADLQNDAYQNVFQPTFSIDLREPLLDSTYQWAEIYYLSVCQGNYTSDGVTKTATSCFKNPSPENLFNLQRAFIPWVIGIAIMGFDLIFMLLFCGGTRHWNGWMMFFLFCALIPLVIGGALGTVFSFTEFEYAKGGSLFVPLTWTAVVALFVGLVVHSFEYGLQKFTPRGDRIDSSHKPDKVSWVSYRPH